jgi:4-amino-4-deoxy-L-arabinose transferase-like glycosyltransferase
VNNQKTRQRLVSLIVLLSLIYLTAAAMDRASERFFWTDEVLTVVIARLPSAAAIWSTLESGTDGNPPAFYLIERAFRSSSTDPHLAYRLSSIIGYLLTLAALFVFVSRRAGAIGGGVAIAIACLTPLFSVYAVEARPYALVMACLAWAMVVWQQIDRPWRAPILGLLLGSAAALHYYAVLGVVPFVLAEVSHTCLTRKVRGRIWLALLTPAVPLVIAWALLQALRSLYGSHFWAPAYFGFTLSAYDDIMGLPYRVGTAVAATVSIGLLWYGVRALRGRERIQEFGEIVLLLGFVSLPCVAYVMAYSGGGGLTPRYVLPATLGLISAIAISAGSHSRRRGAVSLGILVLLVGLREYDYWGGRGRPARDSTNPDLAVLQGWARPEDLDALPLVVSNGHAFVEMSYYEEQSGRQRFTYLADPEAALKHASSDSVEATIQRVSAIMAVDVVPRAQFLQQHVRFLMFSKPDRWDWLYAQVVQEGYRARPLFVTRSGGGSRILYLIEHSNVAPLSGR